jgi:uncharacterized membrane protein
VKPLVVRRERMVTLPADVLWQLVEPADTLPDWLSFVVRAGHPAGKGVGRRQRATLAWSGREVEIEQEVTLYDPARTIAWKHVGGKAPLPPDLDGISMSVTIEEQGPATRVVLAARLTAPHLGVAMKHRFVTKRRLGKAFDRALATFAAVGG